MSERAKGRLLVLGLLLIAAVVFLSGITWGLPSRATDPFLFGDRTPWTGQQILELAGGWGEQRNLGADVDLNPLERRDQVIVLNETDAQRAEIVRRYRLFTHQPDEMITLRALSQMRPGQLKLDPKLYQYGGLWMYPVGAMLKAASIVGYVDLRSGPDALPYYIDHPEAFGRFYVVARLYAALWGLVGVWAVFWIVRRLTASIWLAAAGALCYTLMPVVVNMAHEAKPHLPGAVLMLLAIIAAAKYVETGRTRWWVLTGVLCGAAFGMVISSLLVFIVIPVMVLMRHDAWKQRGRVVVLAGLIGGLTYIILNPYVAINALTNREVLQSNLGNSTAMYGPSLRGIPNAALLIAEGASPVLAVAGAVGGLVLLTRASLRHRGVGCDHTCRGRGDVGWLLLVPASVVLIQFAMLAANKPGEYARFALLPDIALAVAAMASIDAFIGSTRARAILAAMVVVATAVAGVAYVSTFVRDAGTQTSRLAAARKLDDDLGELAGFGEVGVILLAEPAPYSAPPVNLFDHRLLLQPAAASSLGPTPPGWVYPVDRETPLPLGLFVDTPISWADKTFAIDIDGPHD